MTQRCDTIIAPILVNKTASSVSVLKRANHVEVIAVLAKRKNIVFAGPKLTDFFAPSRICLTLTPAITPAIILGAAIVTLLTRVAV
jgi:hypothetical protein